MNRSPRHLRMSRWSSRIKANDWSIRCSPSAVRTCLCPTISRASSSAIERGMVVRVAPASTKAMRTWTGMSRRFGLRISTSLTCPILPPRVPCFSNRRPAMKVYHKRTTSVGTSSSLPPARADRFKCGTAGKHGCQSIAQQDVSDEPLTGQLQARVRLFQSCARAAVRTARWLLVQSISPLTGVRVQVAPVSTRASCTFITEPVGPGY
jgi:hypothetical protein